MTFKIRAERTNEYDWKPFGVIVTPGTLLLRRATNSWGEDLDDMEFIDFIADPEEERK